MNIPQKRNEFGLTEGVIHAYHEDGTINWRAMIAPEHLYPNKGWFESRSKPMPNSIEGLEDSQLLIKLSGSIPTSAIRPANIEIIKFVSFELYFNIFFT